MITITTCSIAVMILFDFNFSAEKMIPFILLLGVMMIAAPGLPGGAIITAAGILQSSLGFTPEMGALMITLYIAQDSFGTACNVTGDGAIAVIVDAVVDKK
jgi:Na+/H+-dicarboxylate symporter